MVSSKSKSEGRFVQLEVDMDYLKKAMDINNEQHKEIINSLSSFKQDVANALADKADKKEVIKLQGKLWSASVGLISLLVVVTGFLISYTLFR